MYWRILFKNTFLQKKERHFQIGMIMTRITSLVNLIIEGKKIKNNKNITRYLNNFYIRKRLTK